MFLQITEMFMKDAAHDLFTFESCVQPLGDGFAQRIGTTDWKKADGTSERWWSVFR